MRLNVYADNDKERDKREAIKLGKTLNKMFNKRLSFYKRKQKAPQRMLNAVWTEI